MSILDLTEANIIQPINKRMSFNINQSLNEPETSTSNKNVIHFMLFAKYYYSLILCQILEICAMAFIALRRSYVILVKNNSLYDLVMDCVEMLFSNLMLMCPLLLPRFLKWP